MVVVVFDIVKTIANNTKSIICYASVFLELFFLKKGMCFLNFINCEQNLINVLYPTHKLMLNSKAAKTIFIYVEKVKDVEADKFI